MKFKDLVVFASEHVHPMSEGELFEKGVLVVLVGDLLFCDSFCCALCLFDLFVVIQ